MYKCSLNIQGSWCQNVCFVVWCLLYVCSSPCCIVPWLLFVVLLPVFTSFTSMLFLLRCIQTLKKPVKTIFADLCYLNLLTYIWFKVYLPLSPLKNIRSAGTNVNATSICTLESSILLKIKLKTPLTSISIVISMLDRLLVPAHLPFVTTALSRPWEDFHYNIKVHTRYIIWLVITTS